MSSKLNGNGLWEGSRMMLPEHVEAIIKQYDSQFRRERIELDYQELEIIKRALYTSLKQRVQIKIKMYDPLERLEIIGIIERIDSQLKKFKVNGDWFNLDDIEGVEPC